jgi:hypothetical protein
MHVDRVIAANLGARAEDSLSRGPAEGVQRAASLSGTSYTRHSYRRMKHSR